MDDFPDFSYESFSPLPVQHHDGFGGGSAIHDGFIPASQNDGSGLIAPIPHGTVYNPFNNFQLNDGHAENDADGEAADPDDYRLFAEKFHMRHGDPAQQTGWAANAGTIAFDPMETDADSEDDFAIPDALGPIVNHEKDEDYREADSDDLDEDSEFERDLNIAAGATDLDDDDDDFDTSLYNLPDRPTTARNGPGRPRGRGRGGNGSRGGRRGIAWALKGTAHDPALRRKKERKAERARLRKPGSQATRKRQRDREPGPEFKKLQQAASNAFIIGDLDLARDKAQAAVAVDPMVFAAHSLLSEIYAARNQPKESLVALLQGATMRKTDPELWILCANKTLDVAGVFRKEEDLLQAAQCLQNAQYVDKENYDIRVQKRDIWLELGRKSRARRESFHMNQMRPDDLENVKLCAELSLACGEPSETAKARDAYERAFELHLENDSLQDADTQWAHLAVYLDTVDHSSTPEYGVTQLKRLARWFLGRVEETCWDRYDMDDREFDATHDRRYDVVEFQADLCSHDLASYGNGLPLDLRVKLGLFRLKMGSAHHTEALAHFEHVYALIDDIANVYDLFYTIADALRQRWVWDAAVKFYEPVKQVETELTDDFWIHLASCYRQLDRFEDAEACYKAVVALDPSNIPARIELSRLYCDDMQQKEKSWTIAREMIALGKKDIIWKERLSKPPVPVKQSARREKLRGRRAGGEATEQANALPEKSRSARRPRPESVASDGSRSPSVPFTPAGEGSYDTFDAFGADLDAFEPEPAKGRKGARKPSVVARRTPRDLLPKDTGEDNFTPSGGPERRYADIVRRDDEREQLMNEQAERVFRDFEVVRDLWPALDEPEVKEEEIFKWMDAARSMYREFRTVRAFYPTRDRYQPFKGFPDQRIRNRTSKAIKEAEVLKRRLEDEGAQRGAEDDADDDPEAGSARQSGPPPIDAHAQTDLHGIAFPVWHRIFTELALLHAKQGDQETCYEILENGLYNANVFYHNDTLINTTQAASICCALMFNDSKRLINVARWFATRSDLRAGSAYHLLAAVCRLAYGDSTWFTAGPTQKFLHRSVKMIDYVAIPPNVRKRYDWAMPANSLTRRTPFSSDGLDPGVLLTYGHMVSVANHSSSALPYYFRAFALRPEDPAVNLSIATIYIGGAMKRQTMNRQYEIQQGLSFLYRYYDLRVSSSTQSLHKQEAEYNVARFWHALGLSHLAVPGYERALALSVKVQEEKLQGREARRELAELGEGEMHGDDGLDKEDFAMEAAFALQSLYAFSGNLGAARRVTEEWLVL
ncbi:hypothetical protein B0A48_12713 [Cryoendolithus antarcticus]|uniref:TPR-like protein n=1 Tax=Cryoendolithus antarcticus TaxID=1507870 RepID=A0A1V8SR85_9PEZI|nr:hypothetical protein B0A48_12713 [Cryoendolithus antarcticus]